MVFLESLRMSLRICAPAFGAKRSAAAAPTAAPTKNPANFEDARIIFHLRRNQNQRQNKGLNQDSTKANVCENFTHHDKPNGNSGISCALGDRACFRATTRWQRSTEKFSL